MYWKPLWFFYMPIALELMALFCFIFVFFSYEIFPFSSFLCSSLYVRRDSRPLRRMSVSIHWMKKTGRCKMSFWIAIHLVIMPQCSRNLYPLRIQTYHLMKPLRKRGKSCRSSSRDHVISVNVRWSIIWLEWHKMWPAL